MCVDVDRRDELCVGCRGSHRTPKHSHRVIGKRTPSDNRMKHKQISTKVLRSKTSLQPRWREELRFGAVGCFTGYGSTRLGICVFYSLFLLQRAKASNKIEEVDIASPNQI